MPTPGNKSLLYTVDDDSDLGVFIRQVESPVILGVGIDELHPFPVLYHPHPGGTAGFPVCLQLNDVTDADDFACFV